MIVVNPLILGMLQKRSSRIYPTLEIISKSLVAAIRKRRAATPQTSRLSALDIGHKNAASVETIAFRIRGSVDPKIQIVVVVF